MDIFLNVLFLIIGLALLIKGADFFVSGASAIAKRFKIPSIIIGLTIVAIGTSLPELSISIISSINNSSDLAIGNVVGSNLFNMLLILGIIALIKHIHIEQSTKKIDIPYLIGVTGLFMIFSLDVLLNNNTENILSRTESIVFLIILIFYILTLIHHAKQSRKNNLSKLTHKENNNQKEEKILKIWQIILFIIFGASAIAFGGECVSTTAQFLAIKMGMSDALVGLTIVALGTSLPELVTSIIAAKKNETDLAIGNILGSSIMNISLILGLVGTISQANISTGMLTDIIILFTSTIIFSIICLKNTNLNKISGAILIFIYFAYLTFAIIRNYCF